MTLPIVDLSAPMATTAAAIEAACRDSGFFYLGGHGVPPALQERLDRASREFFALPEAVKLEIAMEHGGRAWRGFFPVGAELTSGRPDRKEGIYFGAEEPASGKPLHGPNLFPAAVPELRPAVLEYIDRLTGGWYRSTPHRVRNVSGNERLSFPFFFDPDFDAEVPPLPAAARAGAGEPRWDGQDLRAFTGTYGEYLVSKVSKVFPQLRAELS